MLPWPTVRGPKNPNGHSGGRALRARSADANDTSLRGVRDRSPIDMTTHAPPSDPGI